MAAISAIFTADTSRFQRDIAGAQATITAFERESRRAGTTLNTFANQFSGARVIRDAELMAKAVEQIGGVTRLTTAEQQRLSAAVTEGAAKYRALGQEVPQHLKALQGELSGLQQQTSGFGEYFRNLFVIDIASGIQLATQGVKAAADAFGDLVERGTQLIAIRNPFETFAGGAEQASAQLDTMRRSTHNLVDDLSLMQAANKASLLGLTAMGVDLGELTGVATTLGRAMGQDATKSVDDLTTALGRGSVMILDNLGISLKLSDAYDQYAAQLGKTAAQLTEQEKKQAFVTVAMEAARAKAAELGDVQLTLGDRIRQSTVEAGRLYDRMAADLVTNREVNQLFDELGTLIEAAFGSDKVAAAERFNEAISNTAATLRTEVVPAVREIITMASEAAEFLNKTLETVQATGSAIGKWTHPGKLGQAIAGNAPPTPAPAPPSVFAPRAPVSAPTVTPEMVQEARGPVPAFGATDRGTSATDRTTDSTKKLTEAQREAAEAAKRHHEQIAKLTGTDVVNQGKALAAVLADIPVSLVDPKQIDDIRSQLAKAATTAERLGLSAAPFARELAKLPPPLTAVTRELDLTLGIVTQLPDPFGRMQAAITSTVPPLIATREQTSALAHILEPLPDDFARIQQEQTRVQAEQTRWKDSISQTAQAFAQLAQVSGDAFGGALQQVGQMVSLMDAAIQSAGSLGSALQRMGMSQGAAGKVGGVASAGIAGYGAGYTLGQATESRTKGALGGAAQGALTGAMIGSVVPGVGTVIGAGVGAIAGALGGIMGGGGKGQENVVEPFLQAAGGLEELRTQLEAMGQAPLLADLLAADKTKEAEAAVKAITQAYEQEAAAAQRLRTDLARVTEARGVMTQEMAAGLTAQRAGGPGGDVAAEFLQQQADVALTGLQQFTDNAGRLTQSAANAVAAGLSVQFRELQAQGASTFETLQRLQPNVESLRDALVRSGLEGAAGLAPLERAIAVISSEEFGPLVETAQGAGAALAGLGNQGLLTQGMFAGLASSVSDTYQKLVLMGEGDTALMTLQEPLQTIWQLQQDFGFQVDASTQKLLSQAEAAGKIGEKFRPAEDRMVNAIERMADRLEQFLDAFVSGTAAAGAAAADSLMTTVGNLRMPTVRIPVQYDDPGAPPKTGKGRSQRDAEATVARGSSAKPVVVESNVTTRVNLDGREVARSTAKHMPTVLAGYGAA